MSDKFRSKPVCATCRCKMDSWIASFCQRCRRRWYSARTRTPAAPLVFASSWCFAQNYCIPRRKSCHVAKVFLALWFFLQISEGGRHPSCHWQLLEQPGGVKALLEIRKALKVPHNSLSWCSKLAQARPLRQSVQRASCSWEYLWSAVHTSLFFVLV